jgi:hypothetical protein
MEPESGFRFRRQSHWIEDRPGTVNDFFTTLILLEFAVARLPGLRLYPSTPGVKH